MNALRTSPLRPLISFCLASTLLLACASLNVAARAGEPGRSGRAGEPKRAAPAPAAAAFNPGFVGQWGGVIQLQDVPIHISLLPDGRLLYWGRDKTEDGWDRKDISRTYLQNLDNPAQNKVVMNNTTNLFCSGHSFLPDGRLLVTGGHDRYDPLPGFEGIGERDINIFNPLNDTWERLPVSMANGRWYPSNLTLEDGSVMIFSGSYWTGNLRPDGTPEKVSNSIPERLIMTPTPSLQWYGESGLPPFPNYPFIHMAPDGRVLVAGPIDSSRSSLVFDYKANGGVGNWQHAGAPVYNFFEGSATLYDAAKGKVLMAGGHMFAGGTINRETVVMNMSESLNWQIASPLNYARKYFTTVLLPDGKVLAVGGTRCKGFTINCPDDVSGGGAALHPELWDPETKTWSEMAPNPSGIPRVYHSTAILLPDATVLVGGGGLPAMGGEVVAPGVTCGGVKEDPVICRRFGHKDAEVFTPPYLFRPDGTPAPRPVISNSIASVAGKRPFSIETPDPQSIASVVLVRNPSVTHNINHDQRRVVLNFVREGNRLVVNGPTGGKEAPPGPYMLFIINRDGTPSVAKMVTVSYPTVNGERHVARRAIANAATDLYAGTGRVSVFYRHLGDRTLRYMTQTAPNSNTFTPPVDLGHTINSNPLAIQNADGRMQVFVMGVDNAIYMRAETAPGSHTWSNWVGLGVSTSLPAFAVARNLDGRLQVFYRGTNNALWHTSQTAPNSTTWVPAASLGGALASEPAVGLNADGRLEVFYRGTDNALYHKWQLSPGNNVWSAQHELGGSLTSGPFVAHRQSGQLDVFVRGADAGVYHIRQSAPGSSFNWTPWEALGGNLQGDHPYNSPVATLNADGRLQVFVRWEDNTVRTMVQNSPGGGFPVGGWHNLWGWADATVPPPARGSDGRLFLFTRGAGFNLNFNAQTGANTYLLWGGYTALGDGAHSF